MRKTKAKAMIEVTAADPYRYDRLYGREKYSLNNMQMTSANFPSAVQDGYSIWSDRIRKEWIEAWKKPIRRGTKMQTLTSQLGGDAFWNGVSHSDLLTFARRIARAFSFKHKVTGARIVRYTDAGGFPIYRFDIASGGVKQQATTVTDNDNYDEYFLEDLDKWYGKIRSCSSL